MKSINLVFFGLFLLAVISCSKSVKRSDITADELLNEIKYLSSDSLKGRLTGSPGDSLAAEYIREKLTSYGLTPLSGDGLQRFKVTDKAMPGKENSFSVNGENYSLDTDFTPAAFSENGSLKSEVVFAGYGFNIDNDSLKWNDYNGMDVKNKLVMILRADPEPDNTTSKFAPFSGDRYKSLLAKDMGASGVLLVTGQSFDKDDIFDPMSNGDFSAGIPVFRIKRKVADAILATSKTNINDLEKGLNSVAKPNSFSTRTVVEVKSEVVQYKSNTRNVVMELPGEDSSLKNEYLIFGAHFDHLGMGGSGSPSRAPDTIAIHHGADDNASGVAMMIELAGKFALTRGSHKRTMIFIAFTGEEEGLFGSKYFTDNPVIDLSKANVMFNMDMVGCLSEIKDLQVGGVGTAVGLKEKATAICDTNMLKLNFTEEGSGASDYSSFYAKNIPVLFFTTGADAENYHKPSDTWDKINYKGMVVVSDYIFKLASELASDTAKLQFKEAGPKSDAGRVYRRRGATLGIMPDFEGIVKNGLRADLVDPGRPAAIGGMKKGDIIVAIEGKAVNNIQDYMFRMSQLKRGQKISVEIMRNNKKEVLIIQL
jgi:aminopeptidase YwaD